LVPLKFICGLDPADGTPAGERDPQLDAIRGFTRLFPVEEQQSLAGRGFTTIRLGYLKALCRLDACFIDLKRIPVAGQLPTFGEVHFVPVDPRLYTPDYTPPDELRDAFNTLTSAFEDFEKLTKRRRASIQQQALGGSGGVAAGGTDESDGGPSAAGGDIAPVSAVANTSAGAEAKKKRPISRQMTSLVTDVVGGLLTAVASGAGGGGGGGAKAAGMTPEDIQREMEEARRRAREQAALYEEEEERKAAEEAAERRRIALRVAAERAERDRLQQQQQQKRSSVMSSASHGELLPAWGGMEFDDDDDDGDGGFGHGGGSSSGVPAEDWEIREAQRMLERIELVEAALGGSEEAESGEGAALPAAASAPITTPSAEDGE
ncbi:hypothetical protein HK405_014051, partial [Cladochytrium tenue]